ncbi:formate dehydrogenase accessory sulfurtransferase FdhD [Oceanobacillus sp. Castelsardo]|uniref:formate dehydrogenase accessory sulfurtransferase FdhD n=1 Tax=Oceanobacillus sp. Castelsardo TaxID=1851204 RepID=UPI000839A372|nr:formate dehydrogenase accessory sulfurtransferase FdhD [Oceanobacillus sp. Castelsardo]
MYDTKQYGQEIIRFNGMEPTVLDEEIATEFPLTIVLNGKEFATMICSPTNLEDLVIGFLASEGIIRFYNEIKKISIDVSMGFAYVDLNKTLRLSDVDHSKRIISSCCGKSRQFYFRNDMRTAKTIFNRMTLSVNDCYSLMGQLQEQSQAFIRTGGLHNAALASKSELQIIRTDIGRHNTLDKLYGYTLQEKTNLTNKLIVFSGRVSSEVLLKISKIGVGILLSKSAPTDLALNLAQDLGITVIGFARNQKLNIYTHPQRIIEVVD